MEAFEALYEHTMGTKERLEKNDKSVYTKHVAKKWVVKKISIGTIIQNYISTTSPRKGS